VKKQASRPGSARHVCKRIDMDCIPVHVREVQTGQERFLAKYGSVKVLQRIDSFVDGEYKGACVVLQIVRDGVARNILLDIEVMFMHEKMWWRMVN